MAAPEWNQISPGDVCMTNAGQKQADEFKSQEGCGLSPLDN